VAKRKREDEVTPLPVATMEDVARKAGVAISSVSRVLSGHPDVSARMAKKVEEATRALGYEPDILAQSMRSGETRTIGFIITDISNPLFAQVAQSCEQELRKMGYSMILMSSNGDEITESENFAVLRRRRVDGIIA
jgi:LacI family transcriptional regulator